MATNLKFPTLVETAADCALVQLDREQRDDRMLRMELPGQIVLQEFLDVLDKKFFDKFEEKIRVGITEPFLGRAVRDSGITREGRDVLKWRNESPEQRRENPVLIVGDATGTDVDSLKDVRTITDVQIVNAFERQGVKWLEDHIEQAPPMRLFKALVALVRKPGRKIGLLDLSTYLQTTFLKNNSATINTVPQKRLDMLDLIPDERLMDGDEKGRLQKNWELLQALQTSAETKQRAHWEANIQKALAKGDPTAKTLDEYRNTDTTVDRRAKLKRLQYQAVQELLDGSETTYEDPVGTKKKRKKGKKKPRKPFTFNEALNKGLTDPCQAFDDLSKRWKLDKDAADETAVSVEVGEGEDSEKISVALSFVKRSDDTTLKEELFMGAAVLLDQVLYRKIVGDKETHSTGKVLTVRAREYDRSNHGQSNVESKVRDYLVARLKLTPLFDWVDDALEVLLLKKDVFRSAEEYLASWLALVEHFGEQEDQAGIDDLRQILLSLDMDVTRNEANVVETIDLYPVHPYVLVPLLETAKYVKSTEAMSGLSDQIDYVIDRAVPAYPVLWQIERGTVTEYYSVGPENERTRPIFKRQEDSAEGQMNVADSSGLVSIIRSFVGLYSFTTEHLTVLLVDPPYGKGVQNALLKTSSNGKPVKQLSVMVLTLESDRADLDAEKLDDSVTYLPRTKNLMDWSKDTPVEAHIGFLFLSQDDLPKVETGSAPIGVNGGIFNHYSVSKTSLDPDVLADDGSNDVFEVSLQPDSGNKAVKHAMAVAGIRVEKVYATRPMLKPETEKRILAVSERCEWVVVATRESNGVVAPQQLGDKDELKYIGREQFGTYTLFVYSRDVYVVRQKIKKELKDAPVMGGTDNLDKRIEELSHSVPNGVLRLGRGKEATKEQIGIIAAMRLVDEAVDL